MGSENLRNRSNLQNFLRKTTPFVPSQSLPKASIRENSLWQPIGKETVDCFSLGDLWDQYYEWSAYGLGVPVHLANGETAVQYYVPYLSAIQIYTSKSLVALRNVGEDSESDSWSDDSESEKQSKSWDATSDSDSLSEPDGSWPARDRLGHLYFQYVEYCPPYGRIPLMDKVTELARTYPGLMSFKSVDLSPASWMSVSWYPIYHIPNRRTVKDLSACFLTYHTISSSFQDSIPGEMEKDELCSGGEKSEEGSTEAMNCIPLPPFGLATYKARGNLWMPASDDQETLANLYSAADSWLKQLSVHHHDFSFFNAHSTM